MLDAIGELADDGLEFDREAVELAAWFHDAIYVIGATTTNSARPIWPASCWRHRRSATRSPGWCWSPRHTRLRTTTSMARAAAMPICRCWAAHPDRYRAYAEAVRDEYAEFPTTCSNPLGHRCLRHCWRVRSFTPNPGGAVGGTARRNVAEEIAELPARSPGPSRSPSAVRRPCTPSTTCAARRRRTAPPWPPSPSPGLADQRRHRCQVDVLP